jgi:DNA-directed RNA polymerase subunit M/transcription elongation factor TFIIS
VDSGSAARRAPTYTQSPKECVPRALRVLRGQRAQQARLAVCVDTVLSHSCGCAPRSSTRSRLRTRRLTTSSVATRRGLTSIPPKARHKISSVERPLFVASTDLRATSALPHSTAKCPKCDHSRAFFMLVQTRSADEPMTTFFRVCVADSFGWWLRTCPPDVSASLHVQCVKCKHPWKEG